MSDACPSGDLTISGNIHGYCADATGSGSANGHSFTFVPAGPTMTFDGEVVGELNIAPSAGQSCTTGATSFVVAGTVTLL